VNNFLIDVSKDADSDITTIKLSGYIGVNQAETLRSVLDSAVNVERPRLIIDMRAVHFLCSSAVSRLLGAVSEAREKNGIVVFSGIPTKIRAVFGFLDVLDYIDYAADNREAKEAIYAS
jgi:anti-anti-sigma factor